MSSSSFINNSKFIDGIELAMECTEGSATLEMLEIPGELSDTVSMNCADLFTVPNRGAQQFCHFLCTEMEKIENQRSLDFLKLDILQLVWETIRNEGSNNLSVAADKESAIPSEACVLTGSLMENISPEASMDGYADGGYQRLSASESNIPIDVNGSLRRWDVNSLYECLKSTMKLDGIENWDVSSLNSFEESQQKQQEEDIQEREGQQPRIEDATIETQCLFGQNNWDLSSASLNQRLTYDNLETSVMDQVKNEANGPTGKNIVSQRNENASNIFSGIDTTDFMTALTGFSYETSSLVSSLSSTSLNSLKDQSCSSTENFAKFSITLENVDNAHATSSTPLPLAAEDENHDDDSKIFEAIEKMMIN